MDNGLVTSDGTKVLTVVEYDRFVYFIPMKFSPFFEVNTITGLRYVELQRLHSIKNGTSGFLVFFPVACKFTAKGKFSKFAIYSADYF